MREGNGLSTGQKYVVPKRKKLLAFLLYSTPIGADGLLLHLADYKGMKASEVAPSFITFLPTATYSFFQVGAGKGLRTFVFVFIYFGTDNRCFFLVLFGPKRRQCLFKQLGIPWNIFSQENAATRINRLLHCGEILRASERKANTNTFAKGNSYFQGLILFAAFQKQPTSKRKWLEALISP